MKIEFDTARGVWQRNGADFVPQIWFGDGSERPKSCNSEIVSLDCGPRSSLRWSQERDRSSRIAANGSLLTWYLDAGLTDLATDLDETHLQMILRAFDHFSSSIWPQFSEDSFCAILHVGNLPRSTSPAKIKALSKVWRTLAAALPLECIAGLLIDVSELSPSEQLCGLNKELFCHLHLFLKTHLAQLASLTWNCFSRAGSIWTSTPCGQRMMAAPTHSIALALLQIGDSGDVSSWQFLGNLAYELEQNRVSYRVVAMTSLHEQWHQLDEVVVAAPHLSLREKRQLEGFCAAGGIVVRRGLKLGLASEIDFSKWRQLKGILTL